MGPLNKSALIEIFNNKVDEFIGEITKTFPEIEEFSTFKTGFTLMKNLNSRKAQQIFNEYIYKPYKQLFFDKNEAFFLNKTYDIHHGDVDYWETFIGKIRNIWGTLSEENKNVIWQYFQVLCILNEKCVNIT